MKIKWTYNYSLNKENIMLMKDFIVRRINPNLIQPTRAGPAGIFSYIHKKTKEQKEKKKLEYTDCTK
jgi:hypothetical protein